MRTYLWILSTVAIFVFEACVTRHERDRALLAASGIGDLENVNRLVAKSANVNYKSPSGRRFTPLLFATSQRHYAVARFLIEHGADPNAKDLDGKTPLFYALGESREDAEIIELLLKKGANLNDFQNEIEFFSGRNARLREVLDTYKKLY